jgi:hypothetical protein
MHWVPFTKNLLGMVWRMRKAHNQMRIQRLAPFQKVSPCSEGISGCFTVEGFETNWILAKEVSIH